MLSVFQSRLQCAAGGLAVLMAACLAFSSGEAFAQQKHKFSFKAPPGTTKFTQTHLMEVGEAPVYDGLKVVEARGVLVSDYVDGSGNAMTYTVNTMENGDKIFTRGTVMALTTIGSDGARRTSFTSVVALTGGTGKFIGIRGTLRGSGFSDMKTGTSGTQTEGEYWLEK